MQAQRVLTWICILDLPAPSVDIPYKAPTHVSYPLLSLICIFLTYCMSPLLPNMLLQVQWEGCSTGIMFSSSRSNIAFNSGPPPQDTAILGGAQRRTTQLMRELDIQGKVSRGKSVKLGWAMTKQRHGTSLLKVDECKHWGGRGIVCDIQE